MKALASIPPLVLASCAANPPSSARSPVVVLPEIPADAEPEKAAPEPGACSPEPRQARRIREVRAVPVTPDDPLLGKFTLKDALAGLHGRWPLLARIETSSGTLTCTLWEDVAPITVANFVGLARGLRPFRLSSGGTWSARPAYDGVTFHRVIPDFVIQGGGYSSGLVEKSTNPPINLETSPSIVHDYGVISMARTSDPNSATSQFFVVNAKSGAHSLDGQYAAFGHMLEGGTVLDAISAVPTQNTSGFQDVPVSDVVVKSVVRK